MKALLALAAVASFWGAATAFDGMPPAKYQGNLLVSVQFADWNQIGPLCGYPEVNGRYEGCSLPGHMVLPNPCDPEFAGQSFARLACHEKGHELGWPADHPNAQGHPQGPLMSSLTK